MHTANPAEEQSNPSKDEELRYGESGLMIPHSLLSIVDQYAALDDDNVDFPFELFFEENQVTKANIARSLAPSITAMGSKGLTPYSTAHQQNQSLSEVGSFLEMDEMGATLVSFKDQDIKSEVLEELGQEYAYIPDYKLRVPNPIRSEDPTATRATEALFQWPEESGVPQAHREGIQGQGVIVGVLDTGIDADHAEFAHKQIPFRYVSFYPQSPYWPPRDVRGFDTGGHGTHVCGIIAGKGIGVAPQADLCVASVIESETTQTSLSRVISGLDWMLRQFSKPEWGHLPKVLNMSLGFPSMVPIDMDEENYESTLKYLHFVLGRMISSNVLPIAAIGNSGENTFGYPGAFSNTLGIGAVDFSRDRAGFSGGGHVSNPPAGSTSQKPDIMGYGVEVYSATERDYSGLPIYEPMSGTSMASPYVAGIAALYRSAQPGASVSQILQTLKSNTLSAYGIPDHLGNGLAIYR
ncbi:MAG: S8 family serine peptidase [Verrucomicrobiota bacterium]